MDNSGSSNQKNQFCFQNSLSNQHSNQRNLLPHNPSINIRHKLNNQTEEKTHYKNFNSYDYENTTLNYRINSKMIDNKNINQNNQGFDQINKKIQSSTRSESNIQSINSSIRMSVMNKTNQNLNSNFKNEDSKDPKMNKLNTISDKITDKEQELKIRYNPNNFLRPNLGNNPFNQNRFLLNSNYKNNDDTHSKSFEIINNQNVKINNVFHNYPKLVSNTKGIHHNIESNSNFTNPTYNNIMGGMTNNNKYNNSTPDSDIQLDTEQPTTINTKFDQTNKVSKNIWILMNEKKLEFTGIFECDSVEQLYVIESKEIIINNEKYYILIAENDDKNALFFQFFYINFLLETNKEKPFSFEIQNLNNVNKVADNSDITKYSEKIHKCIDNFHKTFDKEKENQLDKIQFLNKLKKTPPQEMFSFSRLICVYYRLLIIRHLLYSNENELKENYKINDINDFLEYLYNVNRVYKEEEKVFKILCNMFGFKNEVFIKHLSPNELNLFEKKKLSFEILNVVDKKNDKRSYYSIIPKDKFKHFPKQLNIDDNLNRKISYLKQELKLNLKV